MEPYPGAEEGVPPEREPEREPETATPAESYPDRDRDELDRSNTTTPKTPRYNNFGLHPCDRL